MTYPGCDIRRVIHSIQVERARRELAKMPLELRIWAKVEVAYLRQEMHAWLNVRAGGESY